MTDYFRVTVEDLATGKKQTTEVAEGDYLLIPFGPCYLNHVQVSGNGSVQLSLKGHRPGGPARTVTTGGEGGNHTSDYERGRRDGMIELAEELTKAKADYDAAGVEVVKQAGYRVFPDGRP